MLLNKQGRQPFAEESFAVSMSVIKENSPEPPPTSRLPIGTILKGSPNFSQTSEGPLVSKTSAPKANSITPQMVASEADQVAALMRANITTMLERGDSVTRLSEKMEQLQAQAYRFRVHTQRTERRLWWRNIRMNIAIALLSMIAIGIVISVLVRGTTSTSSHSPNNVQKSLSQEPFPVATNSHTSTKIAPTLNVPALAPDAGLGSSPQMQPNPNPDGS
ncbi:hypothetical protein MDAP_001278 [Mitosporidium daphniae]|uniref:VAMP72-family R-SNARE protein n=1 Tax=Mitosporidium daphniae TaxID=1485682 RepID=A0A098VR20_9MICR|nr:VAMP72-family R-SNARE protein [Mitosporidium daphniae]KGG51488.1 VAMP72-family R-SNARE protein [Mitosporidium daphniae]|eukprot:XP_013237938.1 VAMP72-family R-SNARE protein [Mitosporidium daphniae]